MGQKVLLLFSNCLPFSINLQAFLFILILLLACSCLQGYNKYKGKAAFNWKTCRVFLYLQTRLAAIRSKNSHRQIIITVKRSAIVCCLHVLNYPHFPLVLSGHVFLRDFCVLLNPHDYTMLPSAAGKMMVVVEC